MWTILPQKNKLVFVVVDLGVGISKNVRRHVQIDISAMDAIVWALKLGNTTKSGDIPGGLGLTLLNEFIEINNGCIQIVSNEGYWRIENGVTHTDNFANPFPGTVVSIEINTADTKSYKLYIEVDFESIF